MIPYWITKVVGTPDFKVVNVFKFIVLSLAVLITFVFMSLEG